MSVSLKESFDIAYDGSENAALMDLFIDDVSDLSSLTHFDSIKILQGSTAKDISTGDLYQMQSDGTWVQQPAGVQLDLTGYYTSAETDTLLAGKQDSLSASQMNAVNSGITSSIVTSTTAVLPVLVNEQGKNRLPITLESIKALNTYGTWSGNVYTRRGITFTINSDMTIDVAGTSDGSGDSWLDLYGTGTTSDFIGMICSGCPSGGSDTTYGQQCGNANWDYGTADGRVCVQGPVAIVVRSGYDASGGLTFKPMICKSEYWNISKTYEPPVMTNAELTAKTIKFVDVDCYLNNLVFTRSYGSNGSNGAWYTTANDSVSVPGLSTIYSVSICGWESLISTDTVHPYITSNGTKIAFLSNTDSFRAATYLKIRAIGI